MPPRPAILVVDDTSTVLGITEAMLTRAGYAVTTATSGSTAIEVVKKHTFDAVLMDVVMDGMTGPEAARALRLLRPGLPVIFMTGFPEYLDTLDAQNETVLEKPFTSAKLTSAISKALNKRKSASSAMYE